MARAEQAQDGNARILAVLMGLAGLYALLAVVNSAVIAGTERRREFAVARVSGLTRSQVVRTAVAEGAAVAVIGVLLGCAVAGAGLAGIGGAVPGDRHGRGGGSLGPARGRLDRLGGDRGGDKRHHHCPRHGGAAGFAGHDQGVRRCSAGHLPARRAASAVEQAEHTAANRLARRLRRLVVVVTALLLTAATAAGLSSPRARGWSIGTALQHRRSQVVPAHAGMGPATPVSTCAVIIRPRTEP